MNPNNDFKSVSADSTQREMPAIDPVDSALEAFLLLAEEPISTQDIAAAAHIPVREAESRLQKLSEYYTQAGHGFDLRKVGKGWRYYTRAQHADLISAWVLKDSSAKLSKAALETLAVVAYLQPVGRSRISAIRGVNVDGVVRTLIARGLLQESGSDPSSGAQLLITTDLFLEKMGITSLDELPALAPYLPDANALEAELTSLGTES